MAEKMPIHGTIDKTGYFRPMTLDEVRHLRAGQKPWIRFKQQKLEEARQVTVTVDCRTFEDATRIEVRVQVGPTRVTLRSGEIFGGMFLVKQRFVLEDEKY